jgi:hypothetical protein
MGRRSGQPEVGPGPRDERGVSAVVGMILVLAISVMGIVAVSNWGLPAIMQLQAQTEERSVLDQFRTLDGTLQQLVSGTAGQTTFKWQPSISSGAIDVNQSANRWLAAADIRPVSTSGGLFVNWTGLRDDDDKLNVIVAGGVATEHLRLHAWRWDGGSRIELCVSSARASCAKVDLSNGVNTTLYLSTNATTPVRWDIRNAVLSFQLNDERDSGAVIVYHEAFLADVGHIHWAGQVGPPVRHVLNTNGAILNGPAGGLVAQSILGVPPPRDFKNSTGVDSTSMFVRFVKLNGTASFSAVQHAEQFAVYLNLAGSYTMGSTGSGENVTSAYLYVFGDTNATIYSKLLDTIAGYRFVKEQNGTTHEDYLRDTPRKPFSMSAVYSLITVED